jgi:hypothetical protein
MRQAQGSLAIRLAGCGKAMIQLFEFRQHELPRTKRRPKLLCVVRATAAWWQM